MSDTIELLKNKRIELQQKFLRLVGDLGPELDELEREVLGKHKIDVVAPSLATLRKEMSEGRSTPRPVPALGRDGRTSPSVSRPPKVFIYLDSPAVSTIDIVKRCIHTFYSSTQMPSIIRTSDEVFRPSGRAEAITKHHKIDADKGKGIRYQTLDLAFLIDCTGNLKSTPTFLVYEMTFAPFSLTGSMKPIIKEVEQKLQDVLKRLEDEFGNIETRVAFVGYRDFGDKVRHRTMYVLLR